LLKDSKTAKDIANELGISKTTCYEILRRLEEKGLVKKSSGKPAFYSITAKGKVLIEKSDVDKARVHNIKVVCQVFEVNLHKVIKLAREVKLNNWTAYYIDLTEICRNRGIPDLNATVQINDAENRTAVLHLPEFYASSRNEAAKIVHNTFNKVRRVLQLEGIILDEDWLDLDFIFC